MSSTHIPLVKKHLNSWGTGRVRPVEPQGADGALTLVLEDAGHLGDVLASDLVGSRTLVFSPGDSTDSTIGYEGSAAEPGGDLSVDDAFFLQTQDYGTSGYMSVIGATLVRVVEEADFAAYLADADRARTTGVFPDFATSPAVQLADPSALGGQAGDDGPRTRLYARADGVLSTSPWAAPLGTLGDSLDRLDAEWSRLNAASPRPCAVALGAAVPEAVRTAALDERPWLGRYLAAVDALRELKARGIADAKVSGFGHRLSSAPDGPGDARDVVDADVPLLLWTESAAYLHVPGPGRVFQLSHTAGALAEALLACGSVDAAAEHADRAGLLQVDRFLTDAGVRPGAGSLATAAR